MTFSIVAHDPQTQQMGVAVATCALAAGRAVPWAEAGVGVVATQAQTSRRYGARGLALLRSGSSPREALDQLLDEDRSPAQRQVAVLGADGEVASWTGGYCLSACGHVIGKGFSAQGNTLASRSVVPSMAEAFGESRGPLAGRLLAALRAAEEAGGDIRGRQSAALIVVDTRSTQEPWDGVPVDLRVDDHAAPIEELARLLELQRAHEDGDWAALAEGAPAGHRGLYVALQAASRGDAAATRDALAQLQDQPGLEAAIRRMRTRTGQARPRTAAAGERRASLTPPRAGMGAAGRELSAGGTSAPAELADTDVTNTDVADTETTDGSDTELDATKPDATRTDDQTEAPYRATGAAHGRRRRGQRSHRRGGPASTPQHRS